MKRCAVVSLPATCGELVQGSLDGVRCLVSLPINRHSSALVELGPAGEWETPADTPKAGLALRRGLQRMNRTDTGGRLEIRSSLPRGRGYGSSTADVGATLYALGRALGCDLQPCRVAELAVAIEPSDSTLFPGLALFAHRDATRLELLGNAPPLSVLVLDPGGSVDTVAFNRANHSRALTGLRSVHRESFALLCQGLIEADWWAVGEAASMSAVAHQRLLENPLLGDTMALCHEVGALGVCRAHSGTLLGLLLDAAAVDVASVVDFVTRWLPSGVTARVHAVVDGGPRTGMVSHD